MNEWYYEINGERHGPVPYDEITNLVASGVILPENYLWTREFGNQWRHAEDVDGLFDKEPPAIPGSQDTSTELFDVCARGWRSVKRNFGVVIAGCIIGLALQYALQTAMQSAILILPTKSIDVDRIFSTLRSGDIIDWLATNQSSVISISTSAIIFMLVWFICSLINTIFQFGYEVKIPLEVASSKTPNISEVFSGFRHWKTITLAWIITCTRIFLLTFLMIVPGIVAAISYSMTQLIIADNNNISAREAIDRSREIMYGHKMEYFALILLLTLCSIAITVLTLGIGMIWFLPYIYVTKSEFYRAVSAQSKK